MNTERICPSCRKPLPPDVPLGLCPECLIKSGFQTGTEPGSPVSGFVPPPVEQIARLFPQLEVTELIGKGGMGAVYKARQPALDRFVALKILRPSTANDAGFAERFNREARALARLNHPNIVAVHDFGRVDGLHYLIMEFVDGANLREVERAGRLSPEQALSIVPQICEALQFAHNEGIVHRDIKPENLLLDKRGRVKITDFGIAKILGVSAGKVSLTGAKDVVGTPHYMAPEQIEKPQTVDHRADIYSLGVVFYEMLTGELPLGKFAAPSAKVQVDVRLDEVVLHALEKEPERRYQQASVLKTDVETIATSGAADSNLRNKPVEDAPRFSRTAIVGAVCAPLSFIPFVWLIALLTAYASKATPGTATNWGATLITTIFFLALTLGLPLVTSALGWLAVAQIRRSAGRVHGLKLALFDGLLFPILMLDAIIGGLWVFLAKLFAVHILKLQGSLFLSISDALIWLLLTVATMTWVDFQIVRRVWRAVQETSAKNETPPRSSKGLLIPTLSLLGVLGIFWPLILGVKQGIGVTVAMLLAFASAVGFAKLLRRNKAAASGVNQSPAADFWWKRIAWTLTALLGLVVLLIAVPNFIPRRGPNVARIIASTIRDEVKRQLHEAGASYDDLQVTVAEERDSATPFTVSYRGLRNFKYTHGGQPDPQWPASASGQFIMSYIGGGQWQGKLGDTQFTVQAGRTDNVDLPFVNDPDIIGEWQTVDSVAEPSGFNPDKPKYPDAGRNFKGLTFLENGKTLPQWWKWTKGVVIHTGDKTANHYEIREIKGQTYLFMEWKSGDVMFAGMKPQYCVLRKKDDGEQARDSRRHALRERFEKRKAQDRNRYTEEQLAEAESLYMLIVENWNSNTDSKRMERLEVLLKKYPDVNRAGCAVLDIAENSRGNVRANYLQDSIEKYSDCFYGDGVQVGAYARFLLAEDSQRDGEDRKAEVLHTEIRTTFTDAIDHRGDLLVNRIGAQHGKRITTDQVIVEDLALRMLAAIRDKEDDVLKSLAVDRVKGWRDALPQFAFEMRERFQQMRGRPFNMLPTESLVEEDYAVVKCDEPKVANQIYVVLYFVKTENGWENWMLRNSPPTKPLADFLKEKPAAK